ncbi:MAG: response regulator [Planctomycetes bacterium]|nr:response regulator [Planctomycetota bacterium]
MAENKGKLLLIEDDEGAALLIKDALEAEGYKVDVGRTGTDGLKQLGANGYIAAILDQCLPDMDGIEVLKRVAAKKLDVPVILITALGNERIAVEAMKRGAADYVVKSADLSHLVALPLTINQCVEKHRIVLENRRLEQEILLKSSKLAEVGTLTAGIAHEFNNLIAGILSHAEHGLASSDPETMRKALSIVVESSTKARHIIVNLLHFASRQDTEKEPANIYDAIESTLAFVERELEKNNIRVIRMYSDVPKTLCNLGQISQVCLNLLTNARDAMLPQGGTVTIRVRQDGDWIEIRFTDTGCGIAPEIHDKVFEPFVTTKGLKEGSLVKGTGMGLTISRQIVDNHGGTIEAESQVGKGATFIIRLPIVTGELQYAPPSTEEEPEPGEARSLRILLVDDNEVFRDALVEILNGEGHFVMTAANAQAAWELFVSQRIDITITDITMPGATGLDLLRAMKKLDQEAKVIVITGQQDETYLRTAQKEGADHFIRKPFKTAEVRGALQRVLAGRLATKADDEK